MRSFTVPASQEIENIIGRKAEDNWRLFNAPGEVIDYVESNCTKVDNWTDGPTNFNGHETREDCARRTRGGDFERVAPSNALLERFERFAFETPRKGWRDDVTGSVANVPAYLAGQPTAMRRRVTNKDAGAPLAVIIDLATSSKISADTIEKRGAAVLALVRLLSMRRPVELWAGVFTGAGSNDRDCAAIFTKIETAPLDLATAAYVLCSAGFPRRLLYSVAHESCGFVSHWPYRNHSTSRAHMDAICRAGFHHVTDALCIPAVHIEDDIASNPQAWIERKLTELSPVDLAA